MPYVVILTCAVSAGIHAALTPEHFAEGTGAGSGFLAASVLLGAIAVVLIWRPDAASVVGGTALLLAGLIGAYALAVTVGVPLLQPEPESVDGLAVATKAIEGAGLLAALTLLARMYRPVLFSRTERN